MAKQVENSKEHQKPQWKDKEKVSSLNLLCKMFILQNSQHCKLFLSPYYFL